jgi:hypothetical protein
MTKNITLAMDEAVLDRIRIIAAQRKTTVNGLVRDFLSGLANEDERLAETRRQLKALMENSSGRMGSDYRWNREEIYAERMFPRHQRADLRRDGKD